MKGPAVDHATALERLYECRAEIERLKSAVADEREACAKIADEHADMAWSGGKFETCQMVARAIRNRADKQS